MPFAVALLCHPLGTFAALVAAIVAALYAAQSHRFLPAFTAVSAALLTLLAFLQVPPSAAGLAWLCVGVALLHAEFLWPDLRRRRLCSASARPPGARACCSRRSSPSRAAPSRSCGALLLARRRRANDAVAHAAAVTARPRTIERKSHRGGIAMERRSALALLAALSLAGALAVPVGGRRRHGADHGRELGLGPRARQAIRREGLDRHRDAPPRRRARVARARRRRASERARRAHGRREHRGSPRARREARRNADRRADQQRRHLQRPRCVRRRSVPRRGFDADLRQLDYELFDTIMAVNVRGPLLVSESLRRARAREPAEEDRLDQLDERLDHVHARRLGRDRVPREQGRVEPRDAARRRQPEERRRHRAAAAPRRRADGTAGAPDVPRHDSDGSRASRA